MFRDIKLCRRCCFHELKNGKEYFCDSHVDKDASNSLVESLGGLQISFSSSMFNFDPRDYNCYTTDIEYQGQFIPEYCAMTLEHTVLGNVKQISL